MSTTTQAVDATSLKLTDVSVSFGGVHAVDGVSLEIRPGEIVGLIGPNGAGKTTLLNMISGQVRADSGRIELGDHDVTDWSVHRRSRLGLARSFQITTVFPELTVATNVELAASARLKRHYNLRYRKNDREEIENTVSTALSTTGLEPSRDLWASSLGHGQARALEVAMLLASGGRTMLLDEPAAGLAAGEVSGIIETIRRVSETSDATIVIVEHKLSVIFGLCDRLAVLDRGHLLAFGTPDEVSADPAVRSAYLGEELDVV